METPGGWSWVHTCKRSVFHLGFYSDPNMAADVSDQNFPTTNKTSCSSSVTSCSAPFRTYHAEPVGGAGSSVHIPVHVGADGPEDRGPWVTRTAAHQGLVLLHDADSWKTCRVRIRSNGSPGLKTQ